MERKLVEVGGEKKTKRKPGEKLKTLSRGRRKLEKIYRWKGLGNALLVDRSDYWHVEGVGTFEALSG